MDSLGENTMNHLDDNVHVEDQQQSRALESSERIPDADRTSSLVDENVHLKSEICCLQEVIKSLQTGMT